MTNYRYQSSCLDRYARQRKAGKASAFVPFAGRCSWGSFPFVSGTNGIARNNYMRSAGVVALMRFRYERGL